MMNSLILDMCECLCTSVFFVYAVHTCVLQGNQNIQRQLSHTHTHTYTGVEHEEGPSVTAERLGWFLRLGNSPYDVATDGQDSPI